MGTQAAGSSVQAGDEAGLPELRDGAPVAATGAGRGSWGARSWTLVKERRRPRWWGGQRRAQIWRKLRLWLDLSIFIGPALIVFLIFVLTPVTQAAYYSVFKWNGVEPLTDFVGLSNYRRALQDERFREAIWHNTMLVFLSLAVQGPLALALSLLLNRRMRGRALLRAIFFAPYVLSEAVTAVVWVLMLQPDGLVDQIMESLGLGRFVQLWLADLNIVMFTLFTVITWKYIGLGIVLFLAGLQGIPRELHEAAAIDGATSWQTLRYITVPLLGPTIRIWGFLAIIGSIQLFDLVWIMTLGGPANASNTMAVYMVDQGFGRSQFGYGSAVAVILFAISLVVALAYQRFVLRRDVQGALTGMAG